FYLVHGNADYDPLAPVIRIYWNVSEDGAERFVKLATSILNEEGVSFQLKILKVPGAFNRTDAAVLYVPDNCYDRAVLPLRTIWREARGYLASAVSAYAKQLAPGVGLAEDPGENRS